LEKVKNSIIIKFVTERLQRGKDNGCICFPGFTCIMYRIYISFIAYVVSDVHGGETIQMDYSSTNKRKKDNLYDFIGVVQRKTEKK
jgi:hypothetical protein